jgi:lysyl-tRNA synthetase, class I
MHWADQIAQEIVKSGKFNPYWVDDMKTPSGYAHIGSMMGPIIHSCIFRALRDLKKDVKLTYIFNDFDTADEFPSIFKELLTGNEGKVLKMVPSPNPNFDNFADFIADDLKKSIEYLGFEAEYISSWDLYHKGRFDDVIRIALDNSDKIQEIYEKVSGSKKKETGWLPFQVICEKCGKLGTTKVFAWDGEEVSYKCEPELVKWAVGCGYEGKISPFAGNGKLPWKVDWAAHWKVLDITIEGAGKDHASAGGSYDIALTILDKIFKKTKPFHFGYEFLLVGGKKMSSSKGLGLKAHDLVNILPAEVARFLFVNNDIFAQGSFDPDSTMAIPDLFDAYDKAWEAYDKNGDEKMARTYVLSQINKIPDKEKGFFVPRFRDIANYLAQGLTYDEILTKVTTTKKGKVDDSELSILEERLKYAKVWIDNYAPKQYRYDLADLSEIDAELLSDLQKKYLAGILNIFNEDDDPQSLQISLYELSKEVGIPSTDAFSAIYKSFINMQHGPRAGMLLTKIGRENVQKRINEVLMVKNNTEKVNKQRESNYTKYFKIDKKLKDSLPSVSVGIALIKGVNVDRKNNDLESEKNVFLKTLSQLTTEAISEYSEVVSYRKVYKETGIDWHSRRPSPEALLRRVALGKGLYTINTCVDAYNLVVMKNRVSVGAFDADQIKFPTTLRFANAGEEILLLGDDSPTLYKTGEIAYFDQVGGYNLDFNYRDSQRTMVTEDTKNVWINVDGVYDVSPDKVEKSLDESVEKILKYCGGKLEFKGVVK